MAPSSHAVYFPALDKCLNGDSLLSWENALQTLSLSHALQSSPALDSFFRDDTVLSILSRPLTPFPPPSPQSKSDFETRTAAIHVLPSSDGHYDIDQIKTDALWLSQDAAVDEVAALRIVILEWQQRAAAQLSTEWSEEERLSVQNATSNANYQPAAASFPDALTDADAQKSLFGGDEQRRARLVAILCAEQTSVLLLSAIMIAFNLPADLHHQHDPAKVRPLIQDAAKAVWHAQTSPPETAASRPFFVECVDALGARTEQMLDPAKWPKHVASNEELAGLFVNSRLAQLVPILRLAFLHTFNSEGLTSAVSLRAWFEFMDQHMFLSELPDTGATDTIVLIRCLVSLISVQLLKQKDLIEHLLAAAQPDQVSYPQLPNTSYWEDDQCLRLITNTMLGAISGGIRHAAPAVLAWSICCQVLREVALATRAERQFEDESSDVEQSSPAPAAAAARPSFRNPAPQPSKFDTKLDLIMDTLPSEDPIAIMGSNAVTELHVFESVTSISEHLLLAFATQLDTHISVCGKVVLFGLLRDGYSLFQYGTEIAQAILTILSYDAVPPNLSRTRAKNPVEPVKQFLADSDGMGARFLRLIQQRYAFELRPFLNCILSISQSRASLNGDESEVLAMLEAMPAFTQVLPPHFEDYELVQEDVMQNCIVLTRPLPVFSSRTTRSQNLLLLLASAKQDQPKGFNFIPQGTIGVILNESRPFIVSWHHQHSGLEYLGTLLSTRLPNATIVDSNTGRPVDRDAAAEIVALVDSLVCSELSVDNLASAKHILGRLSFGLDRSDDIVKVIFDIFEEELQTQIDQPGLEGSLYLLVHCVRLMQTLVSVYPERIWSLMTRSKLLSVNDSTGGLAAIVSATELPLGQYDFLRCCIGLYESLIEDGVKRAVSRKTASKALTRFEEPADSLGSTPEKLMSAVLAAFQRILLDVLQSSPSWKFIYPSDRYDMNARILNAMTCILDYSYRIDDNANVSGKLIGIFASATEVILQVFLVDNPHELTFYPLLNILTSIIAEHDVASPHTDLLVREQGCASLSFCSTVLNVGLSIDRRGDYLTRNLLQTMPLLARIFVVGPSYKAPIATVLTAMTRTLNHVDAEPASLLGHLGSEATKCFLAVISQLDRPVQDLDAETVVWNLLAAVVSNKQQWLAICLLTGTTPRDRLKSCGQKHATSHTKPLLGYALDQLSNIKMLSPKRAIAMLEFVALAQDHWSWATSGIGNHAEFIKSITDWLADLVPNSRPSDLEAVTRTANENQMASLVADILARYLHNARQLGDLTTAKTISAKIQYLRDHGVAVDGYNHSLHQNLGKNFVAKFPQCSLANFKRTGLGKEEFGHEYYYDRQTANKMLAFEQSYSRKSGFADEFARANVNMSLVESQVNLLKSWKALAIELATFADDTISLRRDLAVVAQKCLVANMETLVPAALFDNIAQIRADLAFCLLQRLTKSMSNEPEIMQLLTTAWDTVRTCAQDFGLVSTMRDAEYYRSLLRVLFLALQPHIYSPEPLLPNSSKSMGSSGQKRSAGATPAIANLLLEIVERVVTVNIRALCSAVHADANLMSPTDFVLLTALLQSILRVPGMTNAHASVAAVLATAGTTRYVTSLYSWSHQLSTAANVNDPVYGELSILFLLELSSVPLIAEQMAVEGVLSRLSSANVSQHLRKASGKGPFDEPVRIYNIWMKGMLPLCLNLLEAVGPPIAAEIASFLNSFPEQLRRAESDLENRNPTLRHPYAGSVTMGLAAETHSLSLISLIFERLKMVGPSTGVLASEIPGLLFDRAGVKEEVEGMIRSRRGLRERIVPIGEREAAWARAKADAKDADNLLEQRIVSELEAALVCLTG
ncbi:hypothetical protein MBLNU459_g4189t1 [Dothideomycetes sp. NU459]